MICLANPAVDPWKLSVEEKIEVVRQTKGLLSILLKGLTVQGYLYLRGCTSLISLPEGLKVGGNLYLGDLYLGGCTDLQHYKGKKIKGIGGEIICYQDQSRAVTKWRSNLHNLKVAFSNILFI